jgi:hypothetical protein
VSWPKATKKYQRGVEWAIAEGEHAAALGNPTPDLKYAANAAMDVYGTEPLGADTANYMAFAASKVPLAARQPTASMAQLALEQASWAVVYFEKDHAAPGFGDAFVEAIWADFRRLKDASEREKWTDRTPVAPDFFGPMWPNGLPANWPEPPTASVPTVKRLPAPDVSKLGLPDELIAFLKAGHQLNYDPKESEIGPITLKPVDHLRVDEFQVTTIGTPLERKDPNRRKEGFYTLRAIDLIGESGSYGPEGLLTWFCDYGVFGSYDPDHAIAMAFPNVSWSDIMANPLKYLDAQWHPERNAGKHIEPWKHCEFREE